MPILEAPPRDPIPVASPQVPYERRTPWYAHRGSFYLLIFLLLLNIVATTSISWGPLAVRAFQARVAARQAARQQTVAAAQQAVASAQQAVAARVLQQRLQAEYLQAAAFAL